MSDLTLGTTPARLTVWLVDAAPFAASVNADNLFPAPPELVFDTGTVWPATLDEDGLTAAWLHPAADVDALAALSPRRVTLRDPASHHVWAHGTVYVARVVDNGVPSTVAPGGSITVDTLDGNVSITYGGASGVITSATQPTETDVLWVGPDHDHLADPLDATGQPVGVVPTAQGDGTWAWGPGGGVRTEVRNITSLANPAFFAPGTRFLLARSGDVCSLYGWFNLKLPAQTWVDIVPLVVPVGFRPMVDVGFSTYLDNGWTSGIGVGALWSGGDFRVGTRENNPDFYNGAYVTWSALTWITTTPWPTTLPGVPA